MGGPHETDAGSGGGREYRRCRWLARRCSGRSRPARRVHHSVGWGRRPRHQPGGVEQAAVRSDQGFRADRAAGRHRPGAGRSSLAAGAFAARPDRLREVQSRQARLRFGRRRLDEPAHRRTVQVADRYAGRRSRALQGGRTGGHRSPERANSAGHAEYHRPDHRTASFRQTPNSRRHIAAASCRTPRHSDRRRGGIAGNGVAEFHRSVRAGANAETDCRTDRAGNPRRDDGRRLSADAADLGTGA